MDKLTGYGTTYINPYLSGTIGAPCYFVDAISRGVNFLGLDVICDWWGGEHRTSRVPFWWSAIPVNKPIDGPVTEKDVDYYAAMMLNGHSHYTNDGELEITAASYASDYQTKAENTQYLSMQYIKLYEQSSTITYRTPISLTVGGTSTKTVDSLGHCVNAHAKDSGDDNYMPVYSIADIDTRTTSDFTHTYTASANSITAKIESAHMANVLEKGGLFNKIETGKAATFNLTETTTHSGVSFFNATIAALYGEDLANDIVKYDQYVYTWGDPTVTRRLTQDFCVGGPCLIIKTSEDV